MRDKVVLVTGLRGGSARATALLFAAEGALIVATDVDGPALDQLPRLPAGPGE